MDKENAVVTSERGPVGTNDQVSIESYPAPSISVSYHGKPGGNIIIGQAHGHPANLDPNKVTQRTMSNQDKATSISMQIPIYGIDAMSGKIGRPSAIHRVSPDGIIKNKIGTTVGTGNHTRPGISIGRNALEIWGISSRPKF